VGPGGREGVGGGCEVREWLVGKLKCCSLLKTFGACRGGYLALPGVWGAGGLRRPPGPSDGAGQGRGRAPNGSLKSVRRPIRLGQGLILNRGPSRGQIRIQAPISGPGTIGGVIGPTG